LLLHLPSPHPRTSKASSMLKGVYNPKAVIPHAASLRQASAHCAIFPTAASRRSLGRVSVPVWPVALSGRLPVVALVGHHPTNKLIGREPIPNQHKNLSTRTPCDGGSYPVLDPVSQAYPRVRGRLLTCYSPVRRSSTPEGAFPLDLHVLSTPPAFVLSQDQTLHEMPQNPRHSHRRNIPANATRTHTHTKTRKPRAPVSHARNDGVKLTALAFGTLLSSQGTDAFTEPTRNRISRSQRPGRSISPVQFCGFPTACQTGLFPTGPGTGPPTARTPVSRATPSTYSIRSDRTKRAAVARVSRGSTGVRPARPLSIGSSASEHAPGHRPRKGYQ